MWALFLESAYSDLVRGCFDFDLQFKRPKFVIIPQGPSEGHCCNNDEDLSLVESYALQTSVYSRSEFHHLPPSMDGSVNNVYHSNGLDVRKGSVDDSDVDFMEIHMDLSDDLLHMVFSFLDHANLCRAALVCKQWRAASCHEDFWRNLDFNNRNIYVAQCIGA